MTENFDRQGPRVSELSVCKLPQSVIAWDAMSSAVVGPLGSLNQCQQPNLPDLNPIEVFSSKKFGHSAISDAKVITALAACMTLTLDIRIFDEENQSPKHCGCSCLCPCQK